MIVAWLVLGAVLLALTGLSVPFVPQRPASGPDVSVIRTAAQLDTAIAIQRTTRISELQRRMTARGYWLYALFGFAFLMQMAAIAVDRLAHPSIAAISILPAFFIVITGRAARRRNAQRQLDAYVRSEPSSPGASQI